MGGNALKNYPNKRLDAKNYYALTNDFMEKFENEMRFSPVLIPAYRNKPSFGDADFLVNADFITPDFIEKLTRVFDLNSDRLIRNGSVTSLGWKEFQIDLIKTPAEEMDFALVYFGYNDFGNLLGRQFHKLGIKLGHDGLFLIVRSPTHPTHVIGTLCLSKNSDNLFEILHLDRGKYEAGFDRIEDMFDYVMSSRFFNPDIYLLHNRNHTAKTRDKKRPSYSAFLQYIKDTDSSTCYQFDSPDSRYGNAIKEQYFHDIVIPLFPEVEEQRKRILEGYELHRAFKAYFNGERVSQLTGLKGKALGYYMAKLKSRLTEDKIKTFMSSPETIEHWICEQDAKARSATDLSGV